MRLYFPVLAEGVEKSPQLLELLIADLPYPVFELKVLWRFVFFDVLLVKVLLSDFEVGVALVQQASFFHEPLFSAIFCVLLSRCVYDCFNVNFCQVLYDVADDRRQLVGPFDLFKLLKAQLCSGMLALT